MAQQTQGLPSSAATSAVSFEYVSLRHPSHCPQGMYVMPSETSNMLWDGILFVHKGYYNSAILKFRLTFPPNYPERPPQVHFVTDVFHPLVSQRDGSFSLAPRLTTWRPKDHHVFHILFHIKAAFKKHSLDNLKESDCLNKEAFSYRESTASFAALATQSSLLSQSDSALYDKDHPSMGGKGRQTFVFHEEAPDTLKSLRSQLGLREWVSEKP